MIAKPCSDTEEEPGSNRDNSKQDRPPDPTGVQDPGKLFAVIVPQRPPPGRQLAVIRRRRRVIIGQRRELGKAPSSACVPAIPAHFCGETLFHTKRAETQPHFGCEN